MTRFALAALAAISLAAAALAAPAVAADPPSKAQLRQITKAVKRSPLVDVPARWYTLDGTLISSLSRNWAITRQAPTDAGSGEFQPAYVMLLRPQGLRTWTVVALDDVLVGCGVAPNEVVEDLTGDECPRGQRIKPVPK